MIEEKATDKSAATQAPGRTAGYAVLKPGTMCPAKKTCGVDSFICDDRQSCNFFIGSPADKGAFSHLWVICSYKR